jgi:predicted DCC family thiol-disulfide oxidoreductase YuxK
LVAGDLSTMALEDDKGTVVTESSAAIRAIAALGGAWSLMSAFLVVPRFLRDFVYRWVAAHRYLWFGRRDNCRIPSAEERAQFLD